MRAEQDEAFGLFVAARSRHLLRLAYLLTGDPQQAVAQLQDALAGLYQRWDRLGGDDPESFVRRRLAARGPRRHRGAHPAPSGTADEAAAVRDAVLQALAGLPRRQRAAVVLRHVEDLTDAEIAALLGCSTGVAASAVSRATGRLRDDPGLRAQLA